MRKTYVLGVLAAACLLQVSVLAGELLSARYPLVTGQEIRLKTAPYDPRSLFRGNYARLNYDISSVSRALVETPRELRQGEIIYVSLKENAEGIHEFAGASLEPPEKGLFIRGRVESRWNLRVKYGIEAYFAPKEKALALERGLRNGAVATVMVASNGKAALKDVVVNPAPEDNPQ